MNNTYKISSVHWSNDNILVYCYKLENYSSNDNDCLIELSHEDELLVSNEFESLFHCMPAIAHNRFITFLENTIFDDPESILYCGFVNGSFFQKGVCKDDF